MDIFCERFEPFQGSLSLPEGLTFPMFGSNPLNLCLNLNRDSDGLGQAVFRIHSLGCFCVRTRKSMGGFKPVEVTALLWPSATLFP